MSIPKIVPYAMPQEAALPASRADWPLSPSRAALLIHDMQDYFLDFYAQDASPLVEMMRNVSVVRRACRAWEMPIFYTAQPATASLQERGLLTGVWGRGLPARPERAAIAAELCPLPSEVVIEKHRYSAFFGTELLERLQATGRDQLWICGVYAHIGCLATALDAFMNNIQPMFIVDAVADFGRDQHEGALRLVASCCGRLVTAAQVEAALAEPGTSDQRGDAGGDGAWVLAELSALLRLEVSSIAMEDELLDLGLDSLRRMELGERLDARGCAVDPISMMEVATVAELLGLVQGVPNEAGLVGGRRDV